jgi:TPR repeat protein
VYAWAALRGSNDAMNNLARMLAMGRGVAQVRV